MLYEHDAIGKKYVVISLGNTLKLSISISPRLKYRILTNPYIKNLRENVLLTLRELVQIHSKDAFK